MRAKHQEAGEVELARGDGVEEHREAPNETGRGDAAKGFVFGEAELVDAVGVEAGASAVSMQAASFNLGEVTEERSQELVGTTDEASRRGQKLAVGELRR